MNFKTLKKNESDFKKYLMGTFSANEVALPVKTLNVGTINETVTFEIVEKKTITRPGLFLFLEKLIKLRSYLLILVPMFFVAFKNYLDDRFFDPVSFLSASVSMLFLYGGLNLRNDLNDHLSGFDRVIESTESKPLIKGWVTGLQVSVISWFLFLISGLISIPVFVFQSEERRVFAVTALLFLIGQFFKKNSYKNQRLGEVILFLLMGPGLSCGYQVALGSGIDTEVLFFGVLWGLVVLFLIHLNNFSNLLSSSKAGIQNTMNKMGFDTSKKFLIFWLMAINILWVMYHYFYASTFWTWFGALALLFWSIPTAIQFSNLSSPLGSDLFQAKKTGSKNFLLMIVLLCIEQLWYLGSKINWTI